MPQPKLNVNTETVKKAEKELSEMRESKLSIQLKSIIGVTGNPSTRLQIDSAFIPEVYSDRSQSSQ